MDPESTARDMISSHIDAAVAVIETQTPALVAAASLLAGCLLDEGRVFTCGNGGSAVNAQQLALKMLGRLERERPGLPVFCLSDSAPLITALAAGFGAADVFARQLRALGQPGDVLVALSATGMSANTVQAVIAARDRGMSVIVLSGHDGGDLARVIDGKDIEVRVPVSSALRTEEIHLLLVNVVCDLLERQLFGEDQ